MDELLEVVMEQVQLLAVVGKLLIEVLLQLIQRMQLLVLVCGKGTMQSVDLAHNVVQEGVDVTEKLRVLVTLDGAEPHTPSPSARTGNGDEGTEIQGIKTYGFSQLL
eukprot:CAMPEP_0117605416 /NCGR_PEP_ID=MMETSP0784-20121206/79183_1 /TAXON_ID=39447 /ORGANISM="" /LENGTH=106 /DNA_ID=CAMNT_0005408461 /DNA_START=383 /DNA_END=700 /DNA_ORIENTATION=+